MMNLTRMPDSAELCGDVWAEARLMSWAGWMVWYSGCSQRTGEDHIDPARRPAHAVATR